MARPHLKLPELAPQEIEQFWTRIDKTPGRGPKGDCWFWQGAMTGGYGQFEIWRLRLRIRAPRLSYFLYYGEDPGTLLVCHACDTPLCCNPAHLFKGTPADNMADKVAKGRQSRYLPYSKGEDHPMAILTTEQVLTIRFLHAEAQYSIKKLARVFRVSKTTIYCIVRRKSWTDI